MTGKGKHTLIFGASGISGWSLMKQCLSYPSPSTFHRVTGLCNRHIEKETLLLPNDSRLNIVSGIDLTGSVEIVMEQLKTKVEDIMLVDIVFFCGKPAQLPLF
jgi:nucleoside-diphosphate-sugar epimerase